MVRKFNICRSYGWHAVEFHRLPWGFWTLYIGKLMVRNWKGDGGMLGGVYAGL